MSSFIDYAISHARLTIVTLLFLLRRGLRRLCHDPEGGRAGRPHPDHLRPADAARHQPGGFRAAAAAAGRDAAQVGQQRQGNALDRLRGRRLRAARVRGGLRFQVGAGRRARQGRPGQARPAEGRRRAERAGGQPVALSGAGGGAVRRSAGADACCRSRAPPRTPSSRCPACCRRSCAASRDEAVEIIVEPMLLKSYGVSLDQLIVGFNASNSLVAAGALEGSTGRFAVKVPSLIETAAGRAEDSGGRLQRRVGDARRRRRRSSRPSRTRPRSRASTASRP